VFIARQTHLNRLFRPLIENLCHASPEARKRPTYSHPRGVRILTKEYEMKSMSKARLAPVVLLCLRFVAAGAPPHPVHFTTTTIECNDTAQNVEVRIEIYGEDFEYAIKKYAGSRVSLKLAATGHGERGMNAVREYLNEKFILQDGYGRRIGLALKNLEEKDEWYVMELRAKVPAGLAGARLQNLLLFELQEEGHVNNVVTKYRGKEFKLVFHNKDEFKVIT
jgi:hypothetical protein